jgi:hypothetical protein
VQFVSQGYPPREVVVVVPDDTLLTKGTLGIRQEWGVPMSLEIVSLTQWSRAMEHADFAAARDAMFIGRVSALQDTLQMVTELKERWGVESPEGWAKARAGLM